MNTMETLQRFREARDRGGLYLLARLGADGAFPASGPDISQNYKVFTALQVCGHDDGAHRMCDWIRLHGMTSEGDFQPRPQSTPDHVRAYQNAWVVCGAHRLG